MTYRGEPIADNASSSAAANSPERCESTPLSAIRYSPSSSTRTLTAADPTGVNPTPCIPSATAKAIRRGSTSLAAWTACAPARHAEASHQPSSTVATVATDHAIGTPEINNRSPRPTTSAAGMIVQARTRFPSLRTTPFGPATTGGGATGSGTSSADGDG